MKANVWWGWFGEHWGAPVCDEMAHIPTPVGSKCIDCDSLIGEKDQGISQPFVSDEGVTIIFRHLDCYLYTVLPHGPECPHCRGLEREQHKMSCSYRKHGGDCCCPEGKRMARLIEPDVSLQEAQNIVEELGLEFEDVRAAIKRGKRRAAYCAARTHNPDHESGGTV